VTVKSVPPGEKETNRKSQKPVDTKPADKKPAKPPSAAPKPGAKKEGIWSSLTSFLGVGGSGKTGSG
jgi:hypothetical protein